jgi:hypothetical protein
VLQTLKHLDMRACVAGVVTNNLATGAAILARGGQGGEGKNGIGGAGATGVETAPNQDQLPPNSYGAGATCSVVGNNVGTIDGCGGDGGPGVIQIHVRSLADVLVPNTGTNALSKMIFPRPVGADETNIDAPMQWNRMEPMFGAKSFARSQWIALNATNPIDLRFEGTETNGLVSTDGGGANARVLRLAPVATGTIASQPSLPFIAADQSTLVIDASALSDSIYTSNADLAREFDLEIRHGATSTRFDVASAVNDAGAGTLRLTVAGTGTPLAGFGPGDTFELRPRFFRVRTNSTRDWLPSSASIRIEFQGAPANAMNQPDEAHASAWSADVNALESVAGLAFVRFRVEFDLAADGSDVTLSSPKPSLEFLRVPYRF